MVGGYIPDFVRPHGRPSFRRQNRCTRRTSCSSGVNVSDSGESESSCAESSLDDSSSSLNPSDESSSDVDA